MASPWRVPGIPMEGARHRYGGCCSTMLTGIAVEDAGPPGMSPQRWALGGG